MDALRLYGVSVIRLSDLVKNYSLEQGNLKETAIVANTVRARWAWKDLFRTTIWEVKQAVLEVCPKKHTIKLPDDVERLVNISVVDAQQRIQVLSFNPNLNTTSIKCQKSKCSCTKCNGNETFCGALDNITYTTEVVTIQDVEYTVQVWTRMDGEGNIQTSKNAPYLNAETGEVEYKEIIETVCKMDVTSCGCIAPTATNIGLFNQYFGWFFNGYDWGGLGSNSTLIPSSYNWYGEWNYNAANRDLIHIFRPKSSVNNLTNMVAINPYTGQRETLENDITKVIVCYQSSGECPGEEILIPEYAEMAIMTGMMRRQVLLSPRSSSSDKEQTLRDYNRAKNKVARWLNPVSMADVAKMQTNPRKW